MMARWPRAGTADLQSGRCKTLPADFRVTELLGSEPSGNGEHLYLQIEKTQLGTPEVADHLAARLGVSRADIGYAGMKDKRAVAVQWFSAPVVQPVADLEIDSQTVRLRVLQVSRHERKLRRGGLVGNRFDLLIRGVAGDGWRTDLERVAEAGVPNYFGQQRFGWDNLERALAWLPQRRRRRISRFKQGLYLSVLRSFVFNEVLAARVAAANWSRLIDGDVACAERPTGPLWGRGRSATRAAAAAIESAALAPHAEVLGDLEHAGVAQQRRPLLLRAADLQSAAEAPETVSLSFSLPAGSYATSYLREVFDLSFAEDELE